MFFAYLTLLSALLLALVAGIFSVTGMMALFAGIPMAGLSVGVAIELGKLMAVSWLYRHWKDGVWFRHLMVFTAIVSMLVTSIGVFGYLSKAHFEQGKDVPNNSAKIQVIDEKINRYLVSIERQKDNIKNYEKDVQKLDDQLDVIIKHGNISGKENGSRVVSKEQKPQRDSLDKDIKDSEKLIDAYQEKVSALQEEKLNLGNTIRDFEVEVGPIKSVASVFFDDPEKNIDKAIRIVIFMLMIALDPMAIMLLMGFNHMIMKQKGNHTPPEPSKKLGKKIELYDILKNKSKTFIDVVNQKYKNLTEKKVARQAIEKQPPVETKDIKPSVELSKIMTEKTPMTSDVVNGVTVSVPKHGTTQQEKIEIIKDKINSAPPDGWINTITKRT